jgi:hypothetical protein
MSAAAIDPLSELFETDRNALLDHQTIKIGRHLAAQFLCCKFHDQLFAFSIIRPR